MKSKIFNRVIKVFLIIVVLSFSNLAQSEAEKQGQEIYEKYLAAIGGKENLAKIRTIEIISESEAVYGRRKEILIEDKVNNKRYQSLDGDRSKVEIGFDGKRSWMKQGGRANYTEIRSDNDPIKYVKLPNEKIDGREYLVVEEVRKEKRSNAKTYYDPQTFFLLLRESKAGFGGNTFRITVAWADYRKIGDIYVPFLEVTTNEMTGKITKKILSVKHNIEVDPKIFELKEK